MIRSSTMQRLLRRAQIFLSPMIQSPDTCSIYVPQVQGLHYRSFLLSRSKRQVLIPSEFPRRVSHGSPRGLSRFATGFTPLQPKPLNSIIDMDRVKNFTAEQIVSVWDDFHLGRGHVGTSMKAKLYYLMEQRSIPCRYFVIPLRKGSGYTNMFIQVEMPHMLVTGLEDYKARGTQASPYLTVTYYKEFAGSKDVVLTRGDVVFTSRLTDSEASWLIETAHSFYLNDMRYKLVERFNKQTSDFEFKDVLKALEMPTG